MRLVIATLFLLLSTQVFSIPIKSHALTSPKVDTSVLIKKALVLSECGGIEGLIPPAQALIKRYFETDMFNSDFYTSFIWLEPDLERLASCIICASERASDPYWEPNFNPMCDQWHENSLFATETQEEDFEEVI